MTHLNFIGGKRVASLARLAHGTVVDRTAPFLKASVSGHPSGTHHFDELTFSIQHLTDNGKNPEVSRACVRSLSGEGSNHTAKLRVPKELIMAEPGSVNTSGEWRRALDVSERLIRTTSELELEPRREWLRQVMNEAASQLRAASQGVADQGAHRLRSHVVAADAARSDASLASYFLNFLKCEGLIEQPKALELESLLHETELEMAALSQRLTQELAFDPYAFYPE